MVYGIGLFFVISNVLYGLVNVSVFVYFGILFMYFV